MADELEARIGQQVGDVVPGAGKEVVQAQHIMAVGQQAFEQVAAEKAGTTGDQYPFA